MGVFDTYNDTPFQIKTEGQTITLKFEQGVPVSGQGTVSWSIPVPGADCVTAKDRLGAYAGIVVLLSNTPLNSSNIPVDGQRYDGDPTANPDLHSGDKIGNALVIGSFYEAEQKARGEDLTSGFVVNDIKADTPYYVAAYAVDAQFRYHTEGVRAYSDKYAGVGSKDKPAIQYVKLGPNNSQCVMPSDGTGLVPGFIYEFDLLWDNSFPHRNCERTYRVRINGTDAGTYSDLINAMNKQFALISSPASSPVAPGTGQYYWDAAAKKLYQFNGTALVLVPNVIVDDTDPAIVEAGEYWFKPSTGKLYIRTSGSPGTWQEVHIINFGNVNPTDLQCTDYWFNGTQGYIWTGTTWCVVPTIIGPTNPACPPTDLCGAFWFNLTDSKLYGWNVVTKAWDPRSAVYWPQAPNALTVGTLWYDLTTKTLKERVISNTWTNLVVVNSETQPVLPSDGAYWYKPSTEELFQFEATGSPGPAWIPRNAIVWVGDPASVESCDLWWNSVNDNLYLWDVVNTQWTEVALFFQSSTDPSFEPVVEPGSLWVDTDNGNKITMWDGAAWVDIDVVINPTDPTNPNPGDAWYNPVNKTWYVWEVPSAGVWNAIDPTISEADPTAIPNGTFWFNTATNELYVRNGLSWVSVAYTTTPPFPQKDQLWLNSTNNVLYAWDGTKWIQVNPFVCVSMDDKGRLALTTSQKGAGMNVKVLEPGSPQSLGTPRHGVGYQSQQRSRTYDSVYPDDSTYYPSSSVSEQAFLFNNFVQGADIYRQIYGSDGVSETPSYMELGIGTDGTPDERRALADVIRRQLGYPVVDVEVTKENVDDAISFAIEQFRTRSSLGYKRGFFFLDCQHGQNKYLLTNRQIGYNRIVNVTEVHRMTSAFLGNAGGSGPYGQVVLQHLYSMGTFDLTSYHLMAQYVETMEMLFATRITFTWDEPTRVLHMYNSFGYNERVLLEVTLERTEQEIIKDRWAKNWIREWATSETMLMLANIRGKYGSLPGAGGGVTLNAAELRDRAEKLQEKLLQEIDDYIVQDPEDLGVGTQFVIG